MNRVLGAVLLLGVCTLPVAAQKLAERPLTNDDVVAMSTAGLPHQVIVAKINSSRTDFNTSVDKLLELSKAGLHPDVLTAMASAGQSPAAQAPAAAPAAGGTLRVEQRASTVANRPTNFEGTDCLEPGIYLSEDTEWKILEPTSIAQQSGGGFLQSAKTGFLATKSRAAINGTKAQIRIEGAQPKFLFCFEESQAGLSYTTEGAVNPSEFPLVAFDVNLKKRQRSFVAGKISAWSGARQGAPPDGVREIRSERIKPGVYEAGPIEPLAPGEYAFYFAGEAPSGILFFGGLGADGKLFPFGVD